MLQPSDSDTPCPCRNQRASQHAFSELALRNLLFKPDFRRTSDRLNLRIKFAALHRLLQYFQRANQFLVSRQFDRRFSLGNLNDLRPVTQ